MSIINFALAIAGGFCSWALLPLLGRWTTYFWSLVLMFLIMLTIGALGVAQTQSSSSSSSSSQSYAWGIGSILIISSFLYYGTIGPLTNTLVVEISTSILRSKSIALARATYLVATIVAGVLSPYQLNPTAWNWGAKTGFFWAGGCLISLVFAYIWVPETKDRTTAEMDILFEKKVPARRFVRTEVTLLDVAVLPDTTGSVEKVV